MEKIFYSNCLLEAVKAKIKDPKNVKIIYLPRKITEATGHFVWINKKENTVSHFLNVKNGSLKNPLTYIRVICFKGKIKTMKKEVYDRFVGYKITSLKWEAERKLDKKGEKLGVGEYLENAKLHCDDGTVPSYEGGLPFTKRVPYVMCYTRRKDKAPKVEFVKLEEGQEPKLPKDIWAYRYPNILNDEFNILFGNLQDYFNVRKFFDD